MGTITISGVVTTIYGDATSAAAYLAGSTTGQGWASLATSAQNAALVSATRLLERTDWVGSPTQTIDKTLPQPPDTQPLQWPRTGIVDRNDIAVADTVIPQDVIDASYEIANSLSISSAIADSNQDQKIKSESLTEKVGDLEVSTSAEYFGATSRNQPRFPTTVDELIGLWLEGNEPFVLGTATGAGEVSQFEGADGAYGFTGTGIN